MFAPAVMSELCEHVTSLETSHKQSSYHTADSPEDTLLFLQFSGDRTFFHDCFHEGVSADWLIVQSVECQAMFKVGVGDIQNFLSRYCSTQTILLSGRRLPFCPA